MRDEVADLYEEEPRVRKRRKSRMRVCEIPSIDTGWDFFMDSNYEDPLGYTPPKPKGGGAYTQIQDGEATEDL